MRLVKLGLAAVNTTVGAFGKNVDRALVMVREMAAQDVTVAMFPEQLIGGYPQEDLVQWQRFVDRQWTELERYAAETATLPIVSCLGVTVPGSALQLCRGGGGRQGAWPRAEREAAHLQLLGNLASRQRLHRPSRLPAPVEPAGHELRRVARP